MKVSNGRRNAKPWRRIFTVSMMPVYRSCFIMSSSSNKSELLIVFGLKHLYTQHKIDNKQSTQLCACAFTHTGLQVGKVVSVWNLQLPFSSVSLPCQGVPSANPARGSLAMLWVSTSDPGWQTVSAAFWVDNHAIHDMQSHKFSDNQVRIVTHIRLTTQVTWLASPTSEAQALVCLPAPRTPWFGESYYNTLLCCDYFSSLSVVSRAFSALYVYS